MKNQLVNLQIFIFFGMGFHSFGQLPTPVSIPMVCIEERMVYGTNPAPHHDNYTKRMLTDITYTQPDIWIKLSDGGMKFSRKGKYFISASAPAFYVNRHRLFLKDELNNILLTGTSEYASYNLRGSSKAQLSGVIDVEPDKVYYLIHYTQTVTSIDGGPNPSLGVESKVPNLEKTPETFAQVMIYQLR